MIRETCQRRNLPELFSRLTLRELKPLVARIQGPVQGRKSELVAALVQFLSDAEQVRRLYERLDALSQQAVAEAVHDVHGVLDHWRFQKKYGQPPDLDQNLWIQDLSQLSDLRLFFPRPPAVLVPDLQATLRAFVPAPPPLAITTGEDLPAQFQRPFVRSGSFYELGNRPREPLQMRETARTAALEVKAMLRLVGARSIPFSNKTHRPTIQTVEAVTPALTEGDFYHARDKNEGEVLWATGLAMKAFAWPLLLGAAGLVEETETGLQLTLAGRTALTRPAHELIRDLWKQWLSTTRFDEYGRAAESRWTKRATTAVPPRRQAVVRLLEDVPALMQLPPSITVIKRSAVDRSDDE